ncbi:conserved hypothetical protein [Theileria orientalis strain Shintoku]|uniref:Uncharacterized protein n=1 Tax=Theileria orientalis strain Shintoku TaxID=869250 RepID=J4C384_THEOR|nr:conserved hypothetical protein [Theileria orientalis strain Shintoku]BAM39996.1 conserved hypothetical protein [Theileria orientalis strain Shintoku]|eukprot:XP_009690297.1 conserved hypothetical protein [Theileria orientalis strain Shintoku]
MSKKSLNSLSKIDISDSISDFIDLSQIYSLPSVKFCPRKDEVLSNVSSESDKKSVVSNCSDSISSMTSSDSDDSIVSLNMEDSRKEGPEAVTELQDSYLAVSSGILCTFTLPLDAVISFDKHLDYMSGLTRHLKIIYKHLCVQSSFNVESILKCSFEVFGKLHSTACVLSSFDYASKGPEKNSREFLSRLLDTFKESYSDLVLFNTHVCKLLSSEITSSIATMLLELIPYLMDTLCCTLFPLLRHLDQNETKDDLSTLFEKILGYYVVFCYSFLDHTEELLNKMALLTLYRLTITFVPLDLIHTNKDEGKDEKEMVGKDDRLELVNHLKEEYLRDEFKPSSVVMFELRSKAYVSEMSKHEVDLVKRSVSVLESCLRTGISRRQYPTTHIDNVGCFEMLTSSSVTSLVKSLNFWLLQRLECSSVCIRRVALMIMRHALCTIHFVERDRQFVLSYVYNCLSEEDTLDESLSLISCLSKLYPMKDGAVKKIASLTLKGSNRGVRLRVLECLSSCKFTKKGVSFAVSVLKSLAKTSTAGQGYVNHQGEAAGAGDTGKAQECAFGASEWPAIVDTLVSIARSNSNGGEKTQTVPQEFARHVKRRKLGPVSASGWISLLWSYLTSTEDERAQLFKSLWFTEAMIRFPRIVKSVLELDSRFFRSHVAVYDKFLLLGGECGEESLAFLKDKSNWKALHDLRVPYSLDHFERANTAFNDSYTVTGAGAKNSMKRKLDETKRSADDSHSGVCSCVDCRIDHVIKEYHKVLVALNVSTGVPAKQDNPLDSLDFQFDSLHDVFGSAVCNKYEAPQEDEQAFEILGRVPKAATAESWNACPPAAGASSTPQDFEGIRCNIEDLDCFEYPASMGTEVSLNFSCRSSKYPSDLSVFYRMPFIVNPRPDRRNPNKHCKIADTSPICAPSVRLDSGMRSKDPGKSFNFVKAHLRADEKVKNLYHGTVRLRLSFHNPIVIPARIQFYYMVDGARGPLGSVWIHPRCKY